MKRQDLERQDVFRHYKENMWYDGNFEHQVAIDRNGWYLSSFCEVDGATEFLGNFNSVEELKHLYERLTGEQMNVR